MDNPRPEKVAVVDEVRERFESADGTILAEYRGLDVEQLAELRTALRSAGGAFKVYKNTLVRIAANQVGYAMDDLLVGPTALTFIDDKPDGSPGDAVEVAKALKDFAKDHPALVVKGGVLRGKELTADDAKALADVEPREVLLAKLAGAIAAPMTSFAGLLQAVPRDFAYALQALIEKGGGADAPAAEATEGGDADAPAETPADDSADAAEPAAADDTPSPEAETPADTETPAGADDTAADADTKE